jgi:hypothetical protein
MMSIGLQCFVKGQSPTLPADAVPRRAAGWWRRRSGGQVQFAHMYPVVAYTT